MTITVENYLTCPAGASEPPVMAHPVDGDQSTAALKTPASSPEAASTLSGARLELLALNNQVAAANVALARANEPCARLRALADDLTRAEQDVVSQRSRFDETVGRWIASGCKGNRPDVPPQLIASERELAERAVDARAARAALPDHEAVAQAAAKHVTELAVRRNQVHLLAAVAAAQEYCAAHFRPIFVQYRAAEHRLRNLEDALTLAGHTGAAEQIRETIAAVKSAPPPKADIAEGQRFLSALLADPSCELAP